jgi:23S rRNA (cytidine1920-2'-O)/16S rRNA (cytidine1409-2'-O)-methyltransferase
MTYASRAGGKLEHAIKHFGISVEDLICADFGSNTGGFVDVLLSFGARKVYSIETGHGVLDWKLRQDDKVVVMEKTNAMHVELPEKVDFISIDTSWTKLEKVIPNALNNLKPSGSIVALVKPHYESHPRMLRRGKLMDDFIPEILEKVKGKIKELGLEIMGEIESPLVGEKAKNKEYLLYLKLPKVAEVS